MGQSSSSSSSSSVDQSFNSQKKKYLGQWFRPVKNIYDKALKLKGRYDDRTLKYNSYSDSSKRYDFLKQFNHDNNCDAKLNHFWPHMLDNGNMLCPIVNKGYKNRKESRNCYKDRSYDEEKWDCRLLGGKKSKKRKSKKNKKSKKSKTIKRKRNI